MKQKWIDILNGIADGILPSTGKSIEKTNDGRKINRARMTSSLLSWLLAIALLTGKISVSQLMDLVKFIFTLE